MNTVLWIMQFALAFAFIVHGRMMISPPAAVTSQKGMAYILAIPPTFRRVIGAAEILTGIGLVLPSLLNILPWLTPLAAAGLVVVMIGAIVMHIQRREYPNLGLNAVLLILAVIVVYGRIVVVPL